MSDQEPNPEIQPANRIFRRVLGLLVPTLLLGGVGSLYWLQQRRLDLEYAALTSPHEAAQGIVDLSSRYFAVLALVLGLVASWYVVVAWKTLRTERFPPEGIPVARDTPIRHGTAARRRGYVGLFLAVLMLLTALALPTLGPRALYDVFLPAFELTE